jgi:DNA-binding transcriptional regulator GbsR (MarR family)
MDEKVRLIQTEKEIKIFSDPYRLKIIKTYQRNKKPMTVKNVADDMGEVPANVHYHVKKLLSINILELDHIEVVNGINAKYYKLVNDEFHIDFSNVNNSVEYEKSISHVESIMEKILDEFKQNFSQLAKEKKDKNTKDETLNGMFLSPSIYLSAEESKAFKKDLNELIERYSNYDKTKIEYSMIFGMLKNSK